MAIQCYFHKKVHFIEKCYIQKKNGFSFYCLAMCPPRVTSNNSRVSPVRCLRVRRVTQLDNQIFPVCHGPYKHDEYTFKQRQLYLRISDLKDRL